MVDETIGTVVTKAEPHNQIIIHPEQDRVLSVHELARLQGFPDFYKLSGPIKQSHPHRCLPSPAIKTKATTIPPLSVEAHLEKKERLSEPGPDPTDPSLDLTGLNPDLPISNSHLQEEEEKIQLDGLGEKKKKNRKRDEEDEEEQK
ncbi:hypothetical protein F8388_019940 [Cannabis sativa]|uniref:DNA (cytosine-5-)-methyltransferase n=1 Tax=Cannabis sativa TaxID=3483 RepID=A0A7J6EBI8_CANSA|nr:hypothetical protein G4B88_018060 [Cannabis sativa]KAF4390285.1 hypothetical protein F8388_019940 [Cannabis sativa]